MSSTETGQKINYQERDEGKIINCKFVNFQIHYIIIIRQPVNRVMISNILEFANLIFT